MIARQTTSVPSDPKVALVLSGGGARGAYEVGIIRYIAEQLSEKVRFHVISGTSVGAINGAYVAATCDRPRPQGRMLSRVWMDLTLDEVYKFGWAQMRTLPQVLFGRNLPKISHGSTIGGLVDARFLENIVRTRVPWRGITENLHRGLLDSFSCSATELATGINTVFVQTASGRLPEQWPTDHNQIVVPTAIGAAHTLASGAIPVIFPAVRVGDQLYVDGSLRQNTPIRPAMRLGASRILVVGLRHAEPRAIHERLREQAEVVYPNAMFMLGKMFNALMLDKLEADMARIRRINSIVEAGSRAYGPDFPERLGAAMRGERGRPYTRVDMVLIRPSEDLGHIAWDVMHRTKLSKYEGVVARWMRRSIANEDAIHESDLASYILFDREYVTRLIDLGYEDASKHRADILNLFDA